MDTVKPSEEKTEHEIHEEVVAWLTAAAQSQTAEVLAAQEGLLETFAKAHEEDVASFKFECRRWGDFLALMAERGGKKAMHALNMGAGSVQLILGNGPDRLGEVAFGYDIERDKTHDGSTIYWGGGGSGGGHWHGLRWPDKGKYVVKPVVPSIWVRTTTIALDRTDKGTGGGGGAAAYYLPDSNYIRFTVPSGARVAADDLLRFERAGATLYVPAGQGEIVYAAILAELARNDERP